MPTTPLLSVTWAPRANNLLKDQVYIDRTQITNFSSRDINTQFLYLTAHFGWWCGVGRMVMMIVMIIGRWWSDETERKRGWLMMRARATAGWPKLRLESWSYSASCSVFSEAFLVGGEGELHEAELRMDGFYSIIQRSSCNTSVIIIATLTWVKSTPSGNVAWFRMPGRAANRVLELTALYTVSSAKRS